MQETIDPQRQRMLHEIATGAVELVVELIGPAKLHHAQIMAAIEFVERCGLRLKQ
jgi:hypothetical protein